MIITLKFDKYNCVNNIMFKASQCWLHWLDHAKGFALPVFLQCHVRGNVFSIYLQENLRDRSNILHAVELWSPKLKFKKNSKWQNFHVRGFALSPSIYATVDLDR